jgi:hypothetical protein
VESRGTLPTGEVWGPPLKLFIQRFLLGGLSVSACLNKRLLRGGPRQLSREQMLPPLQGESGNFRSDCWGKNSWGVGNQIQLASRLLRGGQMSYFRHG